MAPYLPRPALGLENPAPAWVQRGGSLHGSEFITGFAVDEEGRVEAAKLAAAADLARKVKVRITHSAKDVTIEKNGRVAYEAAAVTSASTDVVFERLEFRVHQDQNSAYALALLERRPAAERNRAERARALNGLEACAKRALGGRVKEIDSLRYLLRCRRQVVQIYELSQMAIAIGGERTLADSEAEERLFNLAEGLDRRMTESAEVLTSSIDELANLVALRIDQQEALTKGQWTVVPLTRGTSPFTSSFGRAASLAIEREIGRSARHANRPHRGERVLRGVYVPGPRLVTISFTVRSAGDGVLLAGARAHLLRASISPELSLETPQATGIRLDPAVHENGSVSPGAFSFDLWTNKGRRDLLFEEGEDFRLFLRVNRPAFVRLIYVAADGRSTVVDEAFRVGPKDVGREVAYPITFQISPPFGGEYLYGIAFTRRPPPLMPSRDKSHPLRQHREGLPPNTEVAETVLNMTTLPRLD